MEVHAGCHCGGVPVLVCHLASVEWTAQSLSWLVCWASWLTGVALFWAWASCMAGAMVVEEDTVVELGLVLDVVSIFGGPLQLAAIVGSAAGVL